jgi:hypothetical protein
VTRPPCGIPARTLPPCDLEWGHDGIQHANGCDGFLAREHDAEHLDRQRVVAIAGATGTPIIVLMAARANPAGFLAVAQALASGEAKHPGRGLGPSADQDVGDHTEAGVRHAIKAHASGARIGGLTIDVETGLPHAGLAAARGILAVQRAAELATAGGSGQ